MEIHLWDDEDLVLQLPRNLGGDVPQHLMLGGTICGKIDDTQMPLLSRVLCRRRAAEPLSAEERARMLPHVAAMLDAMDYLGAPDRCTVALASVIAEHLASSHAVRAVQGHPAIVPALFDRIAERYPSWEQVSEWVRRHGVLYVVVDDLLMMLVWGGKVVAGRYPRLAFNDAMAFHGEDAYDDVSVGFPWDRCLTPAEVGTMRRVAFSYTWCSLDDDNVKPLTLVARDEDRLGWTFGGRENGEDVEPIPDLDWSWREVLELAPAAGSGTPVPLSHPPFEAGAKDSLPVHIRPDAEVRGMSLVVAPGTGDELYRRRSFCGVGIGRPQDGYLAVEWDPQFGAFVDASHRCITCEAVVLACTPVSLTCRVLAHPSSARFPVERVSDVPVGSVIVIRYAGRLTSEGVPDSPEFIRVVNDMEH